MITYVISPATFASTEADHPANPQLKRLPSDYAMALASTRNQRQRWSRLCRHRVVSPSGVTSCDQRRR
jgi:hypothetical protein